jgi:phosphohistidine swiveling domain-containing protein
LKQSAAKVIRYRDLLADFIEEEKNYTNEDLKNLIELFDKAAIDVYKENFLLNEDVLHTENPLYLEELPQMRLKISDEFVTPLWEAYKKILSCMCINTDTAIEVLENLTTDELLAFLDGDASMKERGKLNRPVAFVVVNNTVSIITDEKVFEISDFLAKQDTDAKNIESAKSEGVVSGKTAYKGKVSGPVVVLRESDYPKAREILEKKENYILVTPMTRPEIAMYFSKALAFVTDEGGITCHAAIVAREMKKPCVISTKFATKVFVDGDIVEVDAEKGIVRVIK